jgi:uncharacterized repeat protein (TIGR03803 family)
MRRKVRSPKAGLAVGEIAGGLVIVCALLVISMPEARAQTFTVLYNFTGGIEGGYPMGAVVRDGSGNIYGTSEGGGSSQCQGGCGVVFKLDKTGRESVLCSFCSVQHCIDGDTPMAGLIRDASGNLYGTTYYGGLWDYGTIFMLDSAGTETVLYNFCNVGACTDGANPFAGLFRDKEGNLYGTTVYGGANDAGTVFEVTTTGTEKVLHDFTGGSDGYYPYGGVVRDTKGNLYGTTPYSSNGAGYGTVYKMDKERTMTVLYTFSNPSNGAVSYAGLVRDRSGNLYGTTSQGGNNGL